MLLTMMATTGTMWGQETTTADVTLSSGTYSTDHIVWSFADGNISIQQLKGTGSTAVNSSYIAAPRVYKGHYLSFVCSDNYTINSISIKCDGSYYGNSMTAGTEVSNNTVTSNTTDISATWTTTAGGSHVISSVGDTGLPAIYIQNVASANNTQLRITKITLTYTHTSSSATATTVTIDATGITNTDVYNSTAAGSFSASVTETESGDDVEGATVTWSSSNTGIATINEDGEVTLVAVGTTTITASYAGESGVYSSSSSTYELTVTSSEPYVQPTEIEIIPNYTFWGKTGQFSGSTYSELSGSKDNVSLAWSRGSGSTYANTTAMRFYKDNTLVFTAPTGYEIKSIVITVSGTYSDLAFEPTGFNTETTTWTGSSETVTMSRPSTGSSYATISQYDITIGLASNTLSVTYNGNGNTGGTVPTDDNEYESGDEVTVLGNTGELVKTGYIWSGWNTQADGEGTNYSAGDKFNITASTTLYAMWTPKAITGLAYTGTPTAAQYDGQAFNPAGLTVTATFNDESQEDVTASVVWTPNPLTIETTSVTGTYMELTVLVEGITVTYAPGTENNPYSVAEALTVSPVNGVYVAGIISSITEVNIGYHNATYKISDDGTDNNEMLVYRGKYLDNADFTSADQIKVGDIVVVTGNITVYNNANQLAAGNYLTSLERPAVDVEAPTFSVEAGGYATEQTVELTCATEGATIKYSYDNENWNDYSEALTINETKTVYAKAIKDANESSVSSAAYYILSNDNNYTVTQALNFAEYPQNNVFVHGIVSTAPTSLLDGGLLTYYISVDGTENNRLQVYKGKNLDNAVFTAVDNIQVGDVVTIFGNVKVYNSQKEFDQGNYLVTWERLETVATPTFTPEEGGYTEAQSVTITCATEGATIYYKIEENEEWAVYSAAIDVAETTTIWAYAAKEGMNSSAVATATYTINIPVSTPSITVDPATVEATAEGEDGTLTVTYENITISEASDFGIQFYDGEENELNNEPDWLVVIVEAAEPSGYEVSYSIEDNDGEARTAYFKVYAMDDNTELVYSNLVTVTQDAYVAPGQDVTDVLNNSFTGITGTTYTEWTNTGTSNAVYVGFSAGQYSTIQLRTKNSNEGIITTTSGGKVTKVDVTWNTSTSSGRKLDIYGKNTAYSEVSDLYNNENQGTKLGTIEYDNNEPLIISGDYEFIGIRSNDGALYLDEIQITWSTGPAAPSITVTPAEVADIPAASDVYEHTVTIANFTISSADDLGFAFCDEFGNIINESKKDNWIEDFEFTGNGPEYTLTYLVTENTDTEARTTYFKVIYDDNTDAIVAASNIVTVTQLGYVAPVATITVDPDEVLDVPAEGDVPEHTVTLANMTISSTDEFEFVYCDAEGNILGNEDPKPNWIELAETEYTSTGENTYSMVYTIAPNEETTPRTGYFKISVEQATDIVYSNLVTVTQAGYVVDYATLPFEFDGGRADIENTNGLTQEGLDSDYGSSPKLKFNGTGDWVILKINETPGILSFDIKGNDFSGGTFTVQTSEDGTTYADLETYTELGAVQHESFDNLGENVRYIKWIYTEKSSGNVALGNIALAEYVAPTPAIAVESTSIEATSAETEGTLNVEYTLIDTDLLQILWFESNGTDATNEPDWITTDINDNFDVDYLIEANDDEARTAYFKVYGLDIDGNDVYSELVTVSQDAYNPPVPTTTYTLASSIESGLHYIITNGTDKAMGMQTNNNRAAVAITIENGATTIAEDAGVYEVVINGPDANGNYTIYDKQYPGYLYAASSGNNHLKTRTDNSDGNSQWSIGFETAGNVIITATGNNTRNLMRYNSSSTCFSCYAANNNQQDIYLYVKENDADYEYYGTAITYTENTIPTGETITVGAGSVMTVVDPTFTNTNPDNLVIEEGGQLIHDNPVNATVQKGISAYSTKSGNGWYLIASPVDNYSTSTIATGTYDLFQYSEPDATWYVDHDIPGYPAAHPFNTLTRGQGYLYANAANKDLDFAGAMIGTETANTPTIDLSYYCTAYPDLTGFNLMGNPFSRNLGVDDMTVGGTAVTMYYGFDDAREEFETKTIASTPIKPGQGFFIQATAAGQQLVFNPSSTKDANEIGLISIEAGDESYIDKAYIQFGGGNTLRKMTFSGDKSQVYVINNREDFAAARFDDAKGSIPVHFKAAADGNYTINIETTNLDFEYFRLLDIFTGEEIDLLAESGYKFQASSEDPAERFILLFQIGNINGVDENAASVVFVYQSGDELFFNGDGTLQVFDVMGRFVMSREIHGNERISAATFNTGVYIFRLVGAEVKTQKIVIRYQQLVS